MHRRVETNEQNAKIGRHLSLIGTAMTNEDFFRAAGEKLLDVHSYHDPLCKFCRTRTRRALPDVFEILVTGTEQSEVHLIAAWIPSDDLLHPLAADGITIVAHSLDVIPRRAVEANHFYHIWDGTEQQGHEFRGAIWAPDWMNPDIPLNRMLRKHELIFETIMKNADYLNKKLGLRRGAWQSRVHPSHPCGRSCSGAYNITRKSDVGRVPRRRLASH